MGPEHYFYYRSWSERLENSQQTSRYRNGLKSS
jgi:hypothetical protein